MVQKLLHYHISRKLGEGKHGEVSLGWDSGLDRVVAIKCLSRGLIPDNLREQFLNDMQRLARLNDPHIGVFYSLELIDSQQYIVREYIEGDTIKDLVRAGLFEYERFLALGCQLTGTLQRMHEAGLFHLNITSQNVFVTRSGQAKLLDFGLPFDKARSAVTEVCHGDLVYLAPEQISGDQVDERTDMYSLGIVFYEMLTGKLPFPTDERSALKRAILDGCPDFTSQEARAIPSEATLLLKKLLAGNPDDRFASTAGLHVTLEEMLSFRHEDRHFPTRAEPARTPRQYLILAVLVVLLLVVWIVVIMNWK